MSQENISLDTQVNQQESSLRKVTPLSKYLAMTLFIALPFIGGWIGYVYAPEKVVEVEKIIVKEVPVAESTQQNGQDKNFEGNQKPLLTEFSVEKEAIGKAQMTWSISSEITNLFPIEETYVTLKIIPDGVSYEGIDQSEIRGIGDGFKLNQTAYAFSPATYETGGFWQKSLEQDKLYRVVAELMYQPASFTCKPDMGKDCIPVYSEEDSKLIVKAKEYISVSGPIRLK